MRLRSFAVILAVLSICFGCFAQTDLNPTDNGKYGRKFWPIANLRNASAYNYSIPSSEGSGSYQFPASTCEGGGLSVNGRPRPVNPFIAADTLTITDSVPANTETVAQTLATYSSGNCTVNPTSPAYSHTTYTLSSGTCGLALAMYDLGKTSGSGIVIIDQAFYDAGCSAATITGSVAGALGSTNISIHDTHAGTDAWYGYNGSGYAQVLGVAATTVQLPNQKAATGTRYLCIDTSGNVTSSATACSGT